MKYENRQQLSLLLLNSSLVTFHRKTNLVQFTGVNLHRCELKLPSDLIEDLIHCTRVLGIKRIII